MGGPVTRPQPTLLYHFSHLRHLASIISSGLWCDTIMQANSRLEVDVGHPEVKETRRSREIEVDPGGVCADYVPFYYAPRSPTMYVIDRGGVPTYDDGLDPLVYLVTTPERVADAGRPFLISDGNCTNAITDFSADADCLDELIDWPLMEARIWKNTADDGDRMRRRAAEFLVHEHLPWLAIQELAVMNQRMLDEVQEILEGHDATQEVQLRPDWYY